MPVAPTKVVAKPGHGYRLNWAPDTRDAEYRGEPFPNALVQSGSECELFQPITLRERTMLRFMNKVTDKADWTTKVFDESIIAKWKQECVNLPDSTPSTQISEPMFSYCIEELQFRAKEHPNSPNGAVRVYNGDVYKSDTAVSEETKLALQKAVRVLEGVPAAQKDWHPGSDGKVLDLVHPSLFPLIYGTSKILPIGAPITTLEDCVKRCGEGEVLPDPKPKVPHLSVDDEDLWSAKFQWLPCEVDISGDKPKILTYINNLHPQHHKELYGLMEDLIQASIPLWNLTLVPSDDLFNTPLRIWYDTCVFIGDTRVPEQPEPQRFDSEVLRRESPTNLREKYGDLPLQVIVKLANIELTPEKPEYEGGTWHVEGKLNEAISATAIYYYSSENITHSSLAFRHQANEESFMEVSYEQDAHEWLGEVFGLRQHGNTIQDIGSVETCEGRLITFPNILQHQVQPFKLADPTKPGHRKIVALFLVDPNARIISTADVPCQRQDWWAEEVLKMPQSSSARPNLSDSNAGGVYKLPPELQKIVVDGVDDFPIGMDKAKDYREKLMEERKKFVLKHQENFAAGEISLCEH
ncbi:hypothetical protein EST38_g5535 [Candolleomyces aberdarensis]|uniref:Duf1665 domain containing protein n=1 Tax=Candolleomyces aberdarensis TaxID=2316362 RepID=A0A4Q2DM24_9AGAR|nr:hypothetical protein EST38_g5535 [Candolleomyces aberdarensis]